MIYVTHDQVEAMTLADRIAIMKGGKIMQLGTPDEIYNRPQNRYVADFIGSPSMNFLDGTLNGETFQTGDLSMPMDGYAFQNGARSEAATIGIRPEHIVTGELVNRAPVTTSVKVELVEPMGSDTLVYAQLGQDQLRVRMDGHASVQSGDDLPIGFEPHKASLFDSASENRI